MKLATIDFVARRRWSFGLSLLIFAVAFASIAWRGLNLGIDFTGGIVIEAERSTPIDIAELRQKLSAGQFGEVVIQQLDKPTDVLIRVQGSEAATSAQNFLVDGIKAALGPDYSYRDVEVLGAQIGGELLRNGLLAALLATLGISAYIAFRFEWQFGVAALIRTVHEVFATVGFFALFQLDFNLPAIAALLALAGYSINDTVVVFDRIRENLQRRINPDFRVVINTSINQTLRRTLLLSTAVELTLAPLLIYGGRTLYSFSLSMVWGVALGTFTSICAAGPLLLYFKPRYATVPVEA